MAGARTTFRGRTRELAELARLAREGRRLVTICGAAGMGKTRLVQEWMLAAGDGATFVAVDLTSARTLDEVAAAISAALGSPRAGGGGATDLLDAIARELARRGAATLVLDNVEQVTAHARTVAGALADVPELAIIVTTREILRLDDEVLLELAPLDLESDAIDLLIDRVDRIAPDHEAEPERREAYAAIVRELDGIPLALELVAPRVALLGAAAVRERLHERLDMTPQAPPPADRPQRTLRRAIEASWALLSEAEASALAQCSVFRGEVSIEALEAIIELPASSSLLEIVHALREKSLLNRSAAPGGGSRFSLYLSIRAFAREKLCERAGRAAAAFERHAAYYARVAERHARDHEGSPRAGQLDALARDRDNIVALVERALAGGVRERDAIERALRSLLALAPLAMARGPIAPLLELLAATLARAHEAGLAGRLCVEARIQLGRCHRRAGNLAAAERIQRDALDDARAVASASCEARAFEELASALWLSRRSDEAFDMLERARELHRRERDVRREGLAWTRTAVFLRERGRTPEAREAADRAVELLRAAGDAGGEAMALTELAMLALETGHPGRARGHVDQATRAVRGSGHWLHSAFVSGILGLVRLAEGELTAAIPLLAIVSEEVRRVGYARFEAGTRAYAGIAHLVLGHVEQAITDLEAGISLIVNAHDRRYRGLFTAFLGAARAERGDLEAAAVALAAASVDLHPEDHLRHVVELVELTVRLEHGSRHPALRGPTTPRERELVDRRLAELARIAGDRDAAAFDLRLGLRYARRGLARAGLATGASDGGAAPDAAPGGLLVEPSGQWVRLPDGHTVSFQNRPVLRQLFAGLARARHDRPGVPVPVDQLRETGWPNEQMSELSARNRLKQSIALIRKLGVGELLVRARDGYLLTPGVPLRYF